MAELFEEMERVKIKLLARYQVLLENGKITEADFDDVVEILDRIDDYAPEELSERLEALARRAQERMSAGDAG